MFKKGEGKSGNLLKKLIQPQQLTDKMENRQTRSRKFVKETVIVMPQYSRQKRQSLIEQKKQCLQVRPVCEEFINESSISYEISIQYRTPEKRSQTESDEIMVRNNRRQKKIGLNNVLEISINNQECQKGYKQKDLKKEFDIFNRRQTRDSQRQSKDSEEQRIDKKEPSIELECNAKRTSSKIIIKEKSRKTDTKGQDQSAASSRGPDNSLLNGLKKKPISQNQKSKKEQKLNKIERKANEIQQKGDIIEIAKQIQQLNRKSTSQHEPSLNSAYSFSNSKSFVKQVKNSSSSRRSSSISNKTIFKTKRLKSEQFCLSSRTIRMVKPDTDPMHYRKVKGANGLGSSMHRGLMERPDLSTISFYDNKQLAEIEESIYEVKSQEISLLQVEDWVKFVCLILKLDKRTFNKIVRLLNKVIEPSDPMEAIFYYAGACVSIYAKIQCQHMFHQHQKQFPQIPHHSQHRRAQIQSLHPILEIKQLRRAEWEVSDTVNFSFELHDTLIDESLSTFELWNKYITANKEKIKKSGFEQILIGTQNKQQRINYIHCSYIIDVIQFLKDLTDNEDAFMDINESKHPSYDISGTFNSQAVSQKQKNLQMILLSIFVVTSYHFYEKYRRQTDSLTDAMVVVSNFSKKVFRFSDKTNLHLQNMMKKSKEMNIQKLLSRIELEELNKMDEKANDMTSKEDIITYLQNKTLWFRNVGYIKTHQQIQWFL